MYAKFLFLGLVTVCMISCNQPTETFDIEATTIEVEAVVETLLSSIKNRDLKSMKSTLSPSGKMELILPGAETSYTVDAFMKLHEGWFPDSTWTMETAILSSTVGERVAAVTTSGMYREPDRGGKPYFNRMIVSYVLEKQEGVWRVVKDHASSIEKSTDTE